MTHIPKEHTAFLAVQCRKMLMAILDDHGVSANVDKDVALDLTQFFLRDIYRIDQQQRGSVSVAKLSGYWAFWVRKLKPINSPSLRNNSKLSEDQLGHINEIISLYFAIELVAEVRQSDGFGDIVSKNCKNIENGTCDGLQCFHKFSANYLTFGEDGHFYTEYITYSMRNRTFGPHHFALLIENIIFSSCRYTSHGIVDKHDE